MIWAQLSVFTGDSRVYTLDSMSDMESLRRALAESPENVPLLQLYAQACVEAFSLSEARETFERILNIQPYSSEARLGVAKVLYFEGKTSEAAIRAETLVKEKPDFAPAFVFLSRLYLSENNKALAEDFYERAIALSKQVADSALEKELGLSRERMEKGENEKSGDQRYLFGSEWKEEDPDSPPGSEDDYFFDDDDDEDPFSNPQRDFSLADFERPKVSFADVGGMEDLKEEIRMKVLYPMQNQELFKAYGKTVGGGVLLYGPPGCGKTLISRAAAGEIDANFFSLGLHQVLDMYIGNSEKNLHQIFQLAREKAPSVIFFDEVDALAADRKDLKQSAGRTLINQFLSEMDGTDSNNEGVLVIGATNAPWHIDPAFRRPGRFDRIIFVPPPDEVARESIVQVMAKDKPINDLDARMLAKKTKHFSGADLKAIFDQGAEEALTLAMKEGRIVPMNTKALVKVAKSIVPSSKPWFESAKNYAMYANQSGFYDDVLSFLGIKK